MIDETTLTHWFTYHAPTLEQQEGYVAIREAALAFARVIVAHTPPSPDQTVAVRKIREAVNGRERLDCLRRPIARRPHGPAD